MTREQAYSDLHLKGVESGYKRTVLLDQAQDYGKATEPVGRAVVTVTYRDASFQVSKEAA